tara:strand:+ start:605 stop:829 length:225 start_codon:yes stop_codon:yes gene_type:complete
MRKQPRHLQSSTNLTPQKENVEEEKPPHSITKPLAVAKILAVGIPLFWTALIAYWDLAVALFKWITGQPVVWPD